MTLQEIEEVLKKLEIKDWPIKHHPGGIIEVNGVFMNAEELDRAMKECVEKPEQDEKY